MTPLRERLVEDLQLRNRSPRRIQTYVGHVARFAQYFGRSPAELGPEQVRGYQLHLLERKLSWSSFNQCLCALRFLYRTTLRRTDYIERLPYGRRPKNPPVVLDRREVLELLSWVGNRKHRMVLTTMYATGMRVAVADIDSRRMTILVARGKGQKQRLVPLSHQLLIELRLWWRQHRDPAWLFPGGRPGCPLSALPVQRSFRAAVKEVGLKKAASTHSLRQTFATELLEIAASPRHLGAEIGGQMVLHTWRQTLLLHSHVHVIATGGGLTGDGQRWIGSRRGYFLPAAVLARKFRGKLLDLLKRSHAQGRLPMTGGLARLADSNRFRRFLSPLYQIQWVVHVEPPAARPEVVLKYLARTTYRVALSNDRMQSISQGRVSFRYKDYARSGCWRCMTLEADEFLRRFSLHILPKGFVRIRGFGLLANRRRAQKLARARQMLGAPPPSHDGPISAEAPQEEAPDSQPGRCPYFGRPTLRLVGQTPRPRIGQLAACTYQPNPFDTS